MNAIAIYWALLWHLLRELCIVTTPGSAGNPPQARYEGNCAEAWQYAHAIGGGIFFVSRHPVWWILGA